MTPTLTQPGPGGISRWGGPSPAPGTHLSELSAAQEPHQHPSRNWKYGLGLEHGCRFTPLFLQTNLLGFMKSIPHCFHTSLPLYL